MSDHIEKRLDELEDLLKARVSAPSVEQSIDTSGKYIRWVQSLIAVIVVVVGIGVTWGLTQGKITTLETEVAILQENVKITKVERDKLRTDFIQMQVKQASVDQLLNGIREDVSEIKDDVKKLTRGR